MTCNLSETISPAFAESHRAVKAGTINELVEKGGRGSCKSSYISLEIILLILKNPLIHACVFRKYGNTLRTTVYTQVVWAIAQLGLTRKFRCTVSPMECTYLPTGQKIMFFGLDDPGKVKSIKVPFGYIGIDWFEELDQFDGPEQIRNVEQSTLRGGSFSFTFKSFNPPAMARNWANRYVLEKKPGQMVHHSTYLTAPPEWLGPRFIADAEHLKLNTAARDNSLKLRDVCVDIACALGNVGVLLINVYVVEKVRVHKVSVALVMRWFKTDVFVKVHGVHIGEVKTLLTAAARKLLIHADRT